MDDNSFYDPPIHNPNRAQLDNDFLNGVNFFGSINQGQLNSPFSPAVSSSEDSDNENPPSPPENELVIELPSSSDFVLQKEAIQKKVVFDTLIRRKNVLIESPPGRGRKLTILEILLKYLQWTKGRIPLGGGGAENFDLAEAPTPNKIYVVTRDFRESKKLMQEVQNKLGESQLMQKIKATVLDHRKYFCVNDEVNKGSDTDGDDIDHSCWKQIRSFNANTPSTSKKVRQEEGISCEYFRNSKSCPDGAYPFTHEDNTVHDIEDFISEGSARSRCPYYDSLHLAEKADLVICSADIFLSPFLRQEYCIDLNDCVVLIDDGYDLENLCKKEASIDITTDQVNKACSIIRAITEGCQHNEDNIGLADLVDFLPRLSQFMARPGNNDNHPDREEILEVINRLDVNALNIQALTNAVLAFAENSTATNLDVEAGIVTRLRRFITVLGLMLSNIDSYRVQLKKRESRSSSNHSETVLQLTCADPSIILSPIDNSAISLLVGSNCVAPYSPFYTEFPDIFTEDQTIKILHNDGMMKERYLFAYTGKGPTGTKLVLDYDTRNDSEVKKEVILSILELCKHIPGDNIALFHSQDYLLKIRQYMQNTPIAPGGRRMLEEEIADCKQIFWEFDINTDADAQRIMRKFQTAARSGNGALLLALHRGKLYKNYDLEFANARAIIHVSIPFGPWYNDNDIVSKRKFLEGKSGERDCLQNKDWYHREAFRILNQSFNYSVQEKQDWGIVIVLDSRMHGERHEFEDMIPNWVQDIQGGPIYHKAFSTLINSVENKVLDWTQDI